MTANRRIPAGIVLFLLGLCVCVDADGKGPFDWHGQDNFDKVNDMMDNINPENCQSKPATELKLPVDTLAQMPKFNQLLSAVVYPNRTNELHVHNMALNRAFFFSYLFQQLNETWEFDKQPGLMYYYFSTAADVSANEYNINGSAVFFDFNSSYAGWYNDLAFNNTLPLFGPRSWRLDDYNDPTNWLREPTNNTINQVDYGAGHQSNYTRPSYKINDWYDLWLPDGWDKEGLDSIRKHSYDVGIKYSNATGTFTDNEFVGMTFFGPPSPGQKNTDNLPVVWTPPYYDCGRSNKWIVSAVSPVVDHIARYHEWYHIRRWKFVASISMDLDFLSIDMNQCPLGIGNQGPNYFHGTARCKGDTTMCEPLFGWGFRRGGYQCVCKPGYRYPPWQFGPFKGIELESATEVEYENGFDCYPVELRQVIPIIRGNGTNTDERKRREANPWEKRRLNHRAYDMDRKAKTVRRDVGVKTDVEDEKTKVVKRETDRKEMVEKLNAGTGTSNVLTKRKRFLRNVGLAEVKVVESGRVKRKIQLRQNDKSWKAAEETRRMYEAEHAARKKRWTPRYKRESREKRSSFDSDAYTRLDSIMTQKMKIDGTNCMNFKPEELELPGDVAFNADTQFSYQARTALRLSHFLSNFLQNVQMYEEYGNLKGDELLDVEQIFGEVLANVMGDLKLKGSGVFYDIDKYVARDGKTRQYFGPYAYRYDDPSDTGAETEGERVNTNFRAIDYAGFPVSYINKPWFRNVKERWQSNTYGLTRFTQKPMVRSNLKGDSLNKFEMYPMYYRAPNETDGWWSAPYFDCDGYVNDWVITYSVPFFGLNSIGSAIEFKGVVIVDVRLDELDLNQCPMDYHVANAFGNTARCHFDTTYCVQVSLPNPGKKFNKGGYKCECLQGWEYPFNDRAWYFDGQTMEEEYKKRQNGNPDSRYNTLKCRISGSTQTYYSAITLILTFLSVLLL